MKQKTFSFTYLIVCVVVLSGCSTIPKPSDTVKAVLVINRNFERVSQFESYIKYDILLEGQSEPHTTFSASSYPLVIDDLPPGEHRIDWVVARMTDGQNEWGIENSGIDFVLQEGFITILDKSFDISLSPVKSEGYTHWYRQEAVVNPLSDEDRQSLVEMIASKDPDGLWQIMESPQNSKTTEIKGN